jgi:hypothetical protein
VEEWFLHHMFPSDVSSLSLLGRLQGTIGGLLELGWRSHNPQPLPGHVARTHSHAACQVCHLGRLQGAVGGLLELATTPSPCPVMKQEVAHESPWDDPW